MASFAEEILYTTVRLEGMTPHGTSVGTGFFVLHAERLFIVTNKHVVAGVTKGTFVLRKGLVEGETKTAIPGEGYSISFSEAAFIGHPSPAVDIAAMNLSAIVSELEASGKLIYWKNISSKLCPGPPDVEQFI